MEWSEGALVLVQFPLNSRQADGPRDEWPWLPGTISRHMSREEWSVVVEVPALAMFDLDREEELLYPVCYRDAGEIRTVSESEWEAHPARQEGCVRS